MNDNEVNPGGATPDRGGPIPNGPGVTSPSSTSSSDSVPAPGGTENTVPPAASSNEWARPADPAPPTPGPSVTPAPHATPAPHGMAFDPVLGWRPTPTPSGSSAYPGAHNPYGATYPSAQTLPRPAGTGSSRAARGVVAGVAALAIALTAGGVGGFVGYALHPDGSPLQIPAAALDKNAAPVIDRSSLASIAAALQPTIVGVKTNAGEGSGVVVSADGNIVTNNHVIEGARTVTVTFNSGKTLPARVVGADPQTDLAVLKVDASDLTFAKWGDSDSVQVGDTVLAIGSPLGLQGSVTAGIVSALHRTITVGGDQRTQFDTGSQITIGEAIQTDAPINAGNSGGALVNTNGEVIGINSAIATQGSSGNIGVGFAISANKAKSVTDQLANGGKVSHPYLGVSVGNSDQGGAQLQSVDPGGPAAKAGLAAGDVVTKVGDRPITGAEDLIGAIQGSSVGAELKLTIKRGGNEQAIAVTVGEK